MILETALNAEDTEDTEDTEKNRENTEGRRQGVTHPKSELDSSLCPLC